MGKEKYPFALPHGHVLCDKYILGRVLGQGGYGITYLAMDKWLGMKVAVKEYFPEIGATRTISTCHVTASSIQKQEEYQKGKEDFLQEARVLAAFTNNPNIVRIHGYFEENGTAYFVMDYIEGISLQKYIANQGGHIHWRDAYEKLLPIIKALEEVHQKDIIHRDISPDNIYITSDGTMKLLDFGAARFQSLNQSHSLDVVLKHGYAPFEQYNRRGKQGPFTDVYALCACFYAAVTGVLPPDAPERMEEDRIESFSVMGYEVPQAVEAVIFKGLEVRSKDRYQNMTELLEALEQAVENNQSEEITIDESNQQENWTTEENNQSVDSQTEENSQLENPTLEETNLSDEQMTDTEKSKSKFLSVLQPILTKWNLLPKKTKLGVGIACCAVLLVGVGIFWFVHPHSYGEWEIVQVATCLDAGLQERKCFCGEKQTEVINALGHHEVVDNAVSATCLESGLTEGSHCEYCELVFVEQEVVPETGHTIGVLPAVAATCTQPGLTEGYGCLHCSDYVEIPQTAIEPLGHTEVTDPEIAATCISEGKTETTYCSACGEVYVEAQTIPKIEHTPVTDSGVAATCGKDGKTEGSHCSVCGLTIKGQETVSALGHNFSGNQCRRCGVVEYIEDIESTEW